MEDVMDNGYRIGYSSIDTEFVRRCDREFDTQLERTVGNICRSEGTRVIGITGPSCSGKTTTAKKIISYYRERGRKLHVISLDDFFKDQFSRDDFIDPKTVDFDSPSTFDTEEFYSFMNDLINRGAADKPIFDFESGDRSRRESIICGEDDIILLEGIQLLYPQLGGILKKMDTKSIFICPESGIEIGSMRVSGKRIRLMRRLVRDCNFRRADPCFTLDLWAGVRRNEDENIFPEAHRCDACIDTTQAYELNILKPYLERISASVDECSEHREFMDGLLHMLDGIQSISRESLSPQSLYNEFV